MLTIKFESGKERRVKAVSAEVQDGILKVYIYTKDRSQLLMSTSFPAKDIRWALLDGSYVVGGADNRYD